MPQQLCSTTRISAEPEGPITVKEHTRHRQRFVRAAIGVMRRLAVRGRVMRMFGGRLRLRISVAARSRSHSSRYVNYHALKGMACLYAKSREA